MSLIYLKVDTKVHTKTMILVGIEIPDYVSSPNKGTLLKTIQNRYMHKFKHDELYKEFCRMMAAGKWILDVWLNGGSWLTEITW